MTLWSNLYKTIPEVHVTLGIAARELSARIGGIVGRPKTSASHKSTRGTV